MARFNVPNQNLPQTVVVSEFLGVDFTNAPENVDIRRSPEACNMVRDEIGKVRKSMGYEKIASLGGHIYGMHFMKQKDAWFIHAGNRMLEMKVGWPKETFENPIRYVLSNDMNLHKSMAFELSGEMYFVDGKRIMIFSIFRNSLLPVEKFAYIPTVFIGRAPGINQLGGQMFESLNLLQSRYKEEFLGNNTDTVYQLSFVPLNPLSKVTVKMKVWSGSTFSWGMLTPALYTVNYATGQIVFVNPLGSPLVAGEDNIIIEAEKTIDGYASRINSCTFGVLFGVRGMPDRLFLSGNKAVNFQNVDWFSEQNRPNYFPDINYAVLGSTDSEITGYSVMGEKIVVHKNGTSEKRNLFVRSADLQNGQAVFAVETILMGAGAIAPHSFKLFDNEQVFLTEQGVCAITTQELTNEKCVQNRSYYLDGKLLTQKNLESAVACVFNDMYVLLVENALYILDGMQPCDFGQNAAYSMRKYAAFYRENVKATTITSEGGRLIFGDDSGCICRFFNNPDKAESYFENGLPVKASWQTAQISKTPFYKQKTLRRMFLRIKEEKTTGAKIYLRQNDSKTLLRTEEMLGSTFTFQKINFAKWTFGSAKKLRIIRLRFMKKKIENICFIFENSEAGQPFRLIEFMVETQETNGKR